MQVIIYYHCNAWEGERHLQRVFKNTPGGRKKLVETFFADKDVKFDEANKELIEWSITHTFPSSANHLLLGGCAHVEEVY